MCRVDELVEGRGRPVRAGDRYLAVFLVDGRVRALDNECRHVGNPVDGGAVEEGRLTCPWHGWTYDVATGDLLTAFGPQPGLRAYQAWVEGDVVLVRVT